MHKKVIYVDFKFRHKKTSHLAHYLTNSLFSLYEKLINILSINTDYKSPKKIKKVQ